jgi:hypothetical protein
MECAIFVLMEHSKDNLPAWYKEFLRKEELFWNHTYPAMTWEEQVQHWEGSFQEMMRSLASSGSDAYEGFNPQAYEGWSASEPRIDEILNLLPGRLQDFDAAKMWAGIKG